MCQLFLKQNATVQASKCSQFTSHQSQEGQFFSNMEFVNPRPGGYRTITVSYITKLPVHQDETEKEVAQGLLLLKIPTGSPVKISTNSKKKWVVEKVDPSSGEVIDRYSSSQEAAIVIGAIGPTAINLCLCGYRRMAYGYTWRLADVDLSHG